MNQEFEEDWTDTMDYFDDKTGCILDGKLVMAAEREKRWNSWKSLVLEKTALKKNVGD